MKTIKPQNLGILTRTYEYGRQSYFAVSVLAFIALGEVTDFLSEVALWGFAAEELGKDAALEAGIPKVKPEFLVSGAAHVPGGEMRAGCLARVRLGANEKLLHVYGDRQWINGSPSDPLPFSSMPLDWAHAFGGEGFANNPDGKGFRPIQADSGLIHRLPNIVHPSHRFISPDQPVEPAAFCPVDFTNPQRFSKAGTHDDAWLKQDFPGFARDMDWTMFNLAQPDQWFDEPLRGDEVYLLENMNPSKPLLEGALPGLAARCFVNRRTDQGESFEEIGTRLATVWFFPHRERAILIYQGACRVQDEEGADILQLVVAAERLGEAKPAEQYRLVLEQRLDKEKGHFFSLRDSDLLPEGLGRTDAAMLDNQALLASEDLVRKNLRKRILRETEKARAIVAGHGLDPDLHGPKLPEPEEPAPDLEHLPEFMDRIIAQGEARKREAEQALVTKQHELEKLFSELGMDFNLIREEIAAKPTGPPSFSAQAQLNSLKQLALTMREQGNHATELEEYLADETFCNRLRDGERQLHQAYRLMAHQQDAAPPMAEQKIPLARQAVANAYATGQSLDSLDLTGADLSGMDLHGATFEGSFMESVNLDGANLEGCNFRNCVLAHASLENANLDNACLENANLGAAKLNHAQLKNVQLENAIMVNADLTGAVFRNARMQGANCSGALFADADFSEVQAHQMLLLESDLKGLKLAGAYLEQAVFLKVDLEGVDFSGAYLKSAVFLGAVGTGACFHQADMTNVRFVERCRFEKADFSEACLAKANLRGACLKGSDFSHAQLDSADLSESDLNGTNFYRASARDTRFVKADLRDALMTSLNAMNASFQRADIRGADLRGANLYQADLARVHADSLTNLNDALTNKVRVYPRRAS